jgi:5-methylcytosine-specific restriction endonuclease McrA
MSRKMEKINGMATYVQENGLAVLAVDPETGAAVSEVHSFSCVDEAIERLIVQVYQINSEIVRRRQQYRCFECGRLAPLEIDHHPVSRARGQRDDRPSNLRGVCTGFGCGVHARKHGG